MRSKISNIVIALFSLFLAVSFSAEAGYKSSYKSSYRSSYKSSSSSRSYSTPSSSTSSKSSSSPSTSKPLSTGTKAVVAGAAAGASVSAGSVSASEKSSGGSTGSKSAEATGKSSNGAIVGGVAAKKSVTGAELVDKKGKISTASKSTVNTSQRIPGTTGRDYGALRKAAPDNVRTIIRERERSGTDWTTLAMMYWMISSSNSHAASLSSSDKDWIQRQIKEQENSGESREAALSELKAAGVDTSSLKVADDSHHADKPSVSFSYDMPKAFTAGHVWVFVVNATQDDKKQAPTCELQGAIFMAEKDNLYVKWKAPASAGQKTEMKCKAFGVEEIKTLVSA
ncbi:TPA: hypothetical protein N2N40_002411 [Citrobacter freundii]|nr:hypothetical protein [Citrobacter freundii]